MVRFIKAVNILDKITDCIPVVSTVKNIGILLYQLIHKVNKVATPVRTLWTDDLKIHALSKSDFIAGIASIPVIGNLTCLVTYVKEAILGKDLFPPPIQIGYLKEASRRWHYGTKKHSYEITALYLARYPNLPEEKQAKSLRFAAISSRSENDEVFKLILNSRIWSTETLKDVLKHAKRTDVANLILNKCKDSLTDEDAGDVLISQCFFYKESSYPIIELLTQKYPNMSINSVGRAIVHLANSKYAFPMAFLLKNFPGIKEDVRKEALLKAFENKNKKIIELLEQNTPGIVEKNLDQVLTIAAKNHDAVILNWLSNQYREKITAMQIGMVLAEQASTMYFENCDKLVIIKEILSAYPNLPPESLIPVMEKAASHNVKLFKFYLNRFTQLEQQHLQDILNTAVYVYGKENGISYFSEAWKQVAELIQNKFPDIKAVNPYL